MQADLGVPVHLVCTRKHCQEPYSVGNGSGIARDQCPRCDAPGEPCVIQRTSPADLAAMRELIEQAIAAGWLKGGGFDIEPAADAVMAAIFGSSAT